MTVRRLTGFLVLVAPLLPAAAAAEPAAFPLGVTAGEVTATSAMLWTRPARSGSVLLKVSRDSTRTSCTPTARTGKRLVRVLRRTVTAAASSDDTVRVTVRNLLPATRYYYRFCQASRSRLGVFTTAPRRSADVPIRFGLTGDADGTIDPATGLPAYNRFEVYRRMVSENNDFNVNLGDVMYSDTAVAGVPPALSLQDKWAKYRLNLSYPNLRRLRGTAALYSQWDDHEFIDDFSLPVNGQALFNAGAKSFLDYNPARFRPGTGLFRTFRWGRNVELFFLDERAFRSANASTEPTCRNSALGTVDPLPQLPQRLRANIASALGLPAFNQPVSPSCLAVLNDPNRTMLGVPQLRAFERAIARSTATWKIIVNELPIMQLYFQPYDRWEGFAAERREVLQFLRQRTPNVVFLTTDFHANLVDTVRLSTFPEEGPSVDTGYTDIVTGPVALKTFAVDTDLKTGIPGASNIIRALFKAPRPTGLGLSCAALDVYSYAQVSVTSSRVTVALKDDRGNPVKETPTGPTCATITIPRR
jgi:alkaline phosphatase D